MPVALKKSRQPEPPTLCCKFVLHKNNNMSKATEIKLVGQPILSQVIGLIDKWDFRNLVKKKKSDHYYKAFKSWDHLVLMLFGLLRRSASLADYCEGLRAMSGKLNHLDMAKAPAKSSAGHG